MCLCEEGVKSTESQRAVVICMENKENRLWGKQRRKRVIACIAKLQEREPMSPYVDRDVNVM